MCAVQIQRVIGEEDVERFRRELAAEGGEAEEEGEEEGEEGDAAAARAGDAGGLGDDDEDGDDGDGFFGADDVGEQEYVELSSADIFNRPGRGLTFHTSVNLHPPTVQRQSYPLAEGC